MRSAGSLLTVGWFLVQLLGACGQTATTKPAVDPVEPLANEVPAPRILRLALSVAPESLDPVHASTQFAVAVQAQIYEPLYAYDYFAQTIELTPLLAAALPEVSDDGLRYTIRIREGVRFHDDECWADRDGEGRDVVARDVVYSLMRMADRNLRPDGRWLFDDLIVGLDAFRDRMDARAAGEPFAWDAPIEGLRVLDDQTLQIELVRSTPRLSHLLATAYAAVVPRECAQYYGDDLASHPVGTGPFTLRTWERGQRIELAANPGYRRTTYPDVVPAGLEELELAGYAGRDVVPLDAIEFRIVTDDEEMWRAFDAGELDLIQVPSAAYSEVFDDRGTLRADLAERGARGRELPLLDYTYRGFNMSDVIVGTPGGDAAHALRAAIASAFDAEQMNRQFYEGRATAFEGSVPPGLDGYVGPAEARDLERARALLVEAGYPGGKGLPPINYATSASESSRAMGDELARQLAEVGIELEVHQYPFRDLLALLERGGDVQMFGLAWGADYPDAEGFLQLFVTPRPPGENRFHYSNPDFDALFDRAIVMQPGPERTELYLRMQAILRDDIPAFGGMARSRHYLWHARARAVVPTEIWYGWYHYIDITAGAD